MVQRSRSFLALSIEVSPKQSVLCAQSSNEVGSHARTALASLWFTNRILAKDLTHP